MDPAESPSPPPSDNSFNNVSQFQHTIPTTEINIFQQNESFQQLLPDDKSIRYIQKLAIYKQLILHSKQIYNKFKAFDNDLNNDLKRISPKKITQTAKLKPRVRSEREPEIQNKYRELDIYKKELNAKRIQKSSIQELVKRVQSMRALCRHKFLEVQVKEKKVRRLQEMVEIKQKQESAIQSNTIQIQNTYNTEIRSLKQQLKYLTTQKNKQKAKFLQSFKKNKKSHSLFEISKLQESQLSFSNNPGKHKDKDNLNGKNMEKQREKESTEETVLKNTYEMLGKRIQVLRAQRKILLDGRIGFEERVKYLDKLKSKLKDLAKL